MRTSSQSMLKSGVILLSALAIALAGFGGYQYLTSLALTRDISRQRQLLAREKRQAAAVGQSITASQPLTACITTQQGRWTWGEQLPAMMTQVSRLIDSSKIQLDTMQPVPAVDHEQLTRFPLRMTLRTDLQHLTDLLAGVRKETPVLAVDQLTIRAGQHADAPLLVDLTLSAFVVMENRVKGERP